MEWSGRMQETARRMWRAGATAQEIADTLGGLSRSSILGWITRQGLQRHRATGEVKGRVRRPGKRQGVAKPARRRAAPKRPDPVRRGSTLVIDILGIEPPARPAFVQPPRQRVSRKLADPAGHQVSRALAEPRGPAGPRPLGLLGSRDCRFVLSGEGLGALFCGEPKREGSPYCETHHGACYLRVSARLRRAGS
jgi:hypothetical protein